MKQRLPGVLALAALAATCLALPACGRDDAVEAGAAAVDPGEVEAVVGGNTAFALDLYGLLREAEGNIFVSPSSISTAVAMTWTGARGNTAAEMATVLHLPTFGEAAEAGDTQAPPGPDPDRIAAAFGAIERDLAASPETRGYELHTANSLWGQEDYEFLDEFTGRLDRHFGAGMNRVDYMNDTEGARQEINAWVEKKTEERIQDLIPKGLLDPATTLVLTNAVYFKGSWASQFDEEATRDEPFHGAKGETVVPMMHQKGQFGYLEADGVQVLDLPYEGGDLSMTIVLPGADDEGGLAALEARLTPELLSSWWEGLAEREVTVALPRFTMTWGTEDLVKHLQALGMNDAFVYGRADFSGIDGTRQLFISHVLHKAFVDVNEEGTEAAAATAVAMKRMAARPLEFRADRPFLFMIRHRATGGVLFMGRLDDPESSS